MTWVSNIINDINSVLLPECCAGCSGFLMAQERLICTVCRHQLPLALQNYHSENSVDRIFYGRTTIEKSASFLVYGNEGISKELIYNLKYRNQQEIGRFFGDWFGHEMKQQNMHEKIMAVVPVPLHRKKLRKRGYNQVTLFGERIAHHLNAVFVDDVLYKTSNNKTQTKKNRFNRWRSVKNLYEVRNTEKLKGKHVLLVDDVVTTGATLEACANALLKIEPVKIYVATLAWVP